MSKNQAGWKGIYKAVFIPATLVTLVLGVFFYMFPTQSNDALNIIHRFTTHELGWFFLLFTVGTFAICGFYAFSRMGNIVLGGEGEKPEYSTMTWLGMVLTSGTGGSLLYLASIEWMWIVQWPPFGVQPESVEAYRWATAYGMFHWGPSAWALYIAVAVPIAYFFYVKKKKNMKMSEYARPLLGSRSDGIAGHAINFLYLFGLLGGVFTSLALGTPAISSGISHIFGLPQNNKIIDVLVIVIWTVVPMIILLFGLQKGFSKVSNVNVWGFYILLGITLILGPGWYILNNATEGLGTFTQEFITMSLATDPMGQSSFPQDWTIFYMSWWAVYALPFGLFIAKISKGRTIRQMVIGTIGAGALGCMIFYMVLPSLGMKLQQDGGIDLFSILNEQGRGVVMVEMYKNAMPGNGLLGYLVAAFVSLLILLSYITGHCAVGYSLAAACEKRLKGSEDPQRWNVAFWLILAGVVSLGLYLLNPAALKPLQTVSIITGFPICFAMVVLIMSFFKQLKKDFPEGVPRPLEGSKGVYGTADEDEE